MYCNTHINVHLPLWEVFQAVVGALNMNVSGGQRLMKGKTLLHPRLMLISLKSLLVCYNSVTSSISLAFYCQVSTNNQAHPFFFTHFLSCQSPSIPCTKWRRAVNQTSSIGMQTVALIQPAASQCTTETTWSLLTWWRQTQKKPEPG